MSCPVACTHQVCFQSGWLCLIDPVRGGGDGAVAIPEDSCIGQSGVWRRTCYAARLEHRAMARRKRCSILGDMLSGRTSRHQLVSGQRVRSWGRVHSCDGGGGQAGRQKASGVKSPLDPPPPPAVLGPIYRTPTQAPREPPASAPPRALQVASIIFRLGLFVAKRPLHNPHKGGTRSFAEAATRDVMRTGQHVLEGLARGGICNRGACDIGASEGVRGSGA